MGQRLFLYTVLITFLGHSAFYTGSLVNKSYVPDLLHIVGHLLISAGCVNNVLCLIIQNRANNVTHTYAESWVMLRIMCRH